MFETNEKSLASGNELEKVIIVDPLYGALKQKLDIQETILLAESAGANVVDVIESARDKPSAATFIGSGKIAEVKASIDDHAASLVIFNHAISPVQERNLGRALACPVIDRTRLILDIFALRAKSHEGMLQVELAQLKHLSTRLVRGWTHLERQKGGIGLRGPGETQLETDRRLISYRIKSLSKKLEKVEKQRKLRRRARDRIPVPVVTLVGYTNAGKSTLFNSLVEESVYTANQLFATLDPTMRRMTIENYGEIILSDTVGFIQDLPHSLVAAFHSTLEEVKKSTLLIHVIDHANPEYSAQIEEVDKVLEEIGADEIQTIRVYNKIDSTHATASIKRRADDDDTQSVSVFLSARAGLGLGLLNQVLYEHLTAQHARYQINLDVSQERLRSLIHERCQVLEESFDDEGGANLLLQLSVKDAGWLKKQSVKLDKINIS